MAAYISVPRDLTRVKTKVLFGLTKRQLICFSIGAAIGIPAYFLIKQAAGISAASLCMIVVMMPMFFFAMYERDGQPLEVILKQIIRAAFVRPKRRPYKTDNYYEALMRQYQAERKVEKIVSQAKERQGRRAASKGAFGKGKAGDQEGHQKGKTGRRDPQDRTAVHPVPADVSRWDLPRKG